MTAKSLTPLLLLLLAGLPASITTSTAAAETPETALCRVCVVHEGETEEELVRATAEYDGETYGFCSATCRERFVEDPVAYVPPVLPRPLPPFEVETLAGEATTSETLGGRLTLLDFWATWCPPCLDTIPRLDALHQRLRDRGFQVVGLSIDEGRAGARKVRRYVERNDLGYPVYLDNSEGRSAWAAMHVRSVPAMFLVDDSGRIVAQWLGHIPFDEVVREVETRLTEG